MQKAIIPTSAASLDQRSREIFKLIVESYLNEGEPVGSRNLARILPQSLSPATIRNVMSDLESLGLIYAPHVSAGRMPTQTGLRFFVDGVMEVGDLSADEVRARSVGTNGDQWLFELAGARRIVPWRFGDAERWVHVPADYGRKQYCDDDRHK